MKQFFAILLLLSSPVILSAQKMLVLSDYQHMFWEQIAATCSVPVQWEKSVEELGETATTDKESYVYTIDCQQGIALNTSSGEAKALSTAEFSSLFDYDFANPYLAEYLELQRDGMTVKATLKAGNETETPLRKQIFEVDTTTGKLRFAAIEVVKNNWLYDFKIHIQVWFDREGRYLRHETETMTSVVMSDAVHTRILGRRSL